jgi:hypothetical protein
MLLLCSSKPSPRKEIDKKIINWQYILSQGEVKMSARQSFKERKKRIRVVGVAVRHRAKLYPAETGPVRVRKGTKVILEGQEGETFIGEVITGPTKLSSNVKIANRIIRRANQEDLERLKNGS